MKFCLLPCDGGWQLRSADAVGIPSRGSEQESELVPKTGNAQQVCPQLGHRLPLGMNRVEGVGRSGDPVGGLGELLLKRTEHAVPDDEDASMVPVDVFRVAAMVYPVMGRGIEHPFQWTQPVHELGGNPELVEQVDGHAREEHFRWETEGGQRPIHPHQQDFLQHALTQRHAQVVVLTLVVNSMSDPKEVDLMAGSVGPVIREVRQDESRNPCDEVRRNLP